MSDHPSTALVTGASRGIGAAIALELAKRGCDVALIHFGDPTGAAEVAQRIEALGRRAWSADSDVADFAAAQRTVAEAESALGPIGLLICNAGITRDGVVWKMDEVSWDAVLDVNLKGCFNYIRALSPALKERRGGRIVNIASINGLRGKFGQANYAASKGGIIALTRAVARELGRYDVTVNAVAPGMVDTEMTRSLPQEFLDRAREESALGRLAQPEDIAKTVAFLCSEDARHITGQCLVVDGGQSG